MTEWEPIESLGPCVACGGAGQVRMRQMSRRKGGHLMWLWRAIWTPYRAYCLVCVRGQLIEETKMKYIVACSYEHARTIALEMNLDRWSYLIDHNIHRIRSADSPEVIVASCVRLSDHLEGVLATRRAVITHIQTT